MTPAPTAPGALDQRDRHAAFARLEADTFDVVVIGAGITGAGVARDAAQRGLRVALVEARDVASGTSSRSSKMIHGGLRYLAQGDVALVREAATERQVLRRIAPHLTQLSPFVMPGSRRGIATMRAGLTAFERLGKVPRSERHRTLDADELLALEPTLASEEFPAGVVYPEFLTNDARLTLANVRSAAAAGAAVLTHAPVTRILVGTNGRAAGVEVRGALPEEDLGAVVRARSVVNAAGPWVDAVRAMEDRARPARLALTKGIHVVVAHSRLPVRDTVITLGADRRPVFAVHSGPVTYLGTTDTFYARPDEWPQIDGDDVQYLFDAMARTFAIEPLAPRDVLSMWAGVRPLIAPEGGADSGAKPSELSRRDEVWVGPSGVISVAGGKLTAYRSMAERIVDRLVADLGTGATRCRTADVPLTGGDVDVAAAVDRLDATVGSEAHRLVQLWGAEAAAIVADADDPRDPTALIASEVRHAVRTEGALRLEDAWIRRCARAWFTLEPLGAGLDVAGTEMAELLGWSPERRTAEIAAVERIHHDSMACLTGATL
ncbi:MAG: glycerol-3-phosphate dehydrogenase/oxidase [Actinobacteria bacterium]|nr:glycerol-3-phosphate dehydrogenase/oxidase [Actinomycetota bacterium]